MSYALLIDRSTRDRIKAAITVARANVIPWSNLRKYAVKVDGPEVKLSDRMPGADRIIPLKAQNVMIPFGFRAAISFEEQPDGLFRHLSVSVEGADAKDKLPSTEAVSMIAIEFGFEAVKAGTSGLVWIEEFEPGRRAINVLQMDTPREGGLPWTSPTSRN